MDILSFSKITKPIYEGGATISMKPESKWKFEVRRTDGTIRYPLGDKWVDNVVLNQFKDQVFNNDGFTKQFQAFFTYYLDILNCFYKHPDRTIFGQIEVGSSNTAADASQTGLQSFVKADSGYYPIGNSVSVSSTTGDCVATIKKYFSVETGSVTYREAGLKVIGESTDQGPAGIGSAGLMMNRITFSDITLSAGEQLIVTVAIKIPTLTATGQTITLAAQNGLDISGTLKLVGTTNRILSISTLTSAGVLTNNSNTWASIFPNAGSLFYLSTNNTHAAFNTASSELNTNAASSDAWAAYTNGNYYRDFTGQWNTGGSNITFQSINLINGGGGVSGYQLLCDNSQTKSSASTLALSLRFSLS